MSINIRSITVDCADPFALAQFWSAVSGGPLADDDNPGDPEASVQLPAGNQPERILFIQVPEGKSVKNRLHFDIAPVASTLVEEVERIVALGATVVDDRRRPTGAGWIVLADPAGNEFCVESSHAEVLAARAAQQA